MCWRKRKYYNSEWSQTLFSAFNMFFHSKSMNNSIWSNRGITILLVSNASLLLIIKWRLKDSYDAFFKYFNNTIWSFHLLVKECTITKRLSFFEDVWLKKRRCICCSKPVLLQQYRSCLLTNFLKLGLTTPLPANGDNALCEALMSYLAIKQRNGEHDKNKSNLLYYVYSTFYQCCTKDIWELLQRVFNIETHYN